jgi:putative hemolysin
MISTATNTDLTRHAVLGRSINAGVLASDSRYVVRLTRDADEMDAALALRYEVFTSEMEVVRSDTSCLEFDAFDSRCEHLVAIERVSGRVVGTYRTNYVSADENVSNLYSFQEFDIEALPQEIIQRGVEIGRACISHDHRSSKVLFLLWKALARYLVTRKKRYFFGCCSIFSREPNDGAAAYQYLMARGAIHTELNVVPRRNAIDVNTVARSTDGEPPHLFEMYLRLGAKVCGPPMYDADFSSVDFFVLFDLEKMNDRYRRMFFD